MIPGDKAPGAMLHLAVDEVDAGSATQVFATIRVRHAEGGWKGRVSIPVGYHAAPATVALPAGAFSIDITLPSGVSISEDGRIAPGGEETIVLKPPAVRDLASAQSAQADDESAPSERRSAIYQSETSHSLRVRSSAKSMFARESVDTPRQHSLQELMGEFGRLRFWRRAQGAWKPARVDMSKVAVSSEQASFVPMQQTQGILLAEVRGSDCRASEFCLVPTDWRDAEERRVAAAVVLSAESNSVESTWQLRVHTDVPDAELATLSAYVTQGAASEVLDIGDAFAARAEMLLSGKYRNPWLATAAALTLIKSRRISLLHDWTRNLAQDFAFLPDAAVVRAWHLLFESSAKSLANESAHDWLLAASNRGVPLFTESLRLLVAGLRLFDSSDDGLARRWETYLWATDPDETFTSFCGADPDRPSASLAELPESDGQWSYLWSNATMEFTPTTFAAAKV